jgi:2-methylcitrate dehydratase PrpD
VVPAALAVAERVQASGERFVRAVVLGYDICTRVNDALGADGLADAARSTHSIGGVFGAGAAAGALLGFDAEKVRHLVSYCAQQASGVGCNVRDTDHIEKAFDFGGMPARNGVAAATLVAHGFTGVDDVFSGERNFFEAYAAAPDPARLVDGLGERYEILNTNIKKWSVGSPAQSALDALTHLMQGEAFALRDIETVCVHLPTRSARTVDNAPMPDVNVQHLLALLLVDGGLTFHSVHDRGRMSDPAVLAVQAKVVLVPSQELMDARPPRQAIVEVVLGDGRRLSHRTVAVRGTAANPMTTAEVEAKALDLVADIIGTARARGLIETCRAIEGVSNMRDLRRFWEASSAQGRIV